MDTPTAQTPLAIRRVSLDALHLDPANARAHGEENMEASLPLRKRPSSA